jgi:hypothetical protein
MLLCGATITTTTTATGREAMWLGVPAKLCSSMRGWKDDVFKTLLCDLAHKAPCEGHAVSKQALVKSLL